MKPDASQINNIKKPMIFIDFSMFFGCPGAKFCPSWSQGGAKLGKDRAALGQIEAKLDQVGLKLGQVGPGWAPVGSKLGQVGPSWGQVGPS